MPSNFVEGKTFAANYRTHVVPRLQNLLLAEARCVAARVTTYPSACSVLIAYARQYGAGYLPERDFTILIDWLGAELLRAVIHLEDSGHWAGWLGWFETHCGPFSTAALYPPRRAP